MAGVRQAEIWRAFMNNYERAQKLTTVALESNGSATEKFSVYMENLQAKVNQLRAAWEKLVYSEGSKKLFGNIIDLGKGLIKVLDSLINNEFVKFIATIALVEIAVVGLTKAFKSLMATNIGVQIQQSLGMIQGTTTAIAGATEAANGLKTGLISLQGLFKTAFVIGGILLAIKAIKWLIEANDRYVESLQESIAENKKAIGQYSDEINQLEKLQKEVKATNGNKEDLLSLNSQIRDVLGDDITLYDSEAQAYKAINAELESQIALKKEKLRLEEKEKRDNEIKEFDATKFKLPQHLFKGDSEDAVAQIAMYEAYVETENQRIAEWTKEIDAALERGDEHSLNLADVFQKQIDSVDDTLNKRAQEMDSVYDQLDKHSEKLFSLLLPDLYDVATSPEAQSIGKELIKSIVYGGDAKNFESASAKFDEMKPVLKEVSDLTIEFKNNIGESSSTESLDKLLSKLNEVAQEYPMTTDFINGLKDSLISMGKAGTEAGEEIAKSAEEIKKEYEEAAKSMQEVIDLVANHGKEIQEINDAVAENGYLTTDSLNSILDMYPQLTDAVAEYIMGLRDEASMLEELNQAYQADKDSATRALIEKMENNETFWKSVILGNSQLVEFLSEQYGIDLTNYKTYNELKRESEASMRATLEEYGEDYTAFLKEKYGEDSVEFKTWNADKEAGTLQAINNMMNRWAEFFGWLKTGYANTMMSIQKDTDLSPIEKGLGAIKSLTEGLWGKLSSGAKKMAEQAFDSARALNEINNVSFAPAEMGINSLASSLGNVSSAAQSAENAMSELVDMVVKMLKQNANNDKKYFQNKIKQAQDSYNKQKKLLQREYQDRKKALQNEQKERKRALDDWYDARKKALEDSYKATHDALEKEKEEELDAIEDRIDAYEKLIDAKIKALEKDEEEHDYKREEEKKIKEIADLENKLAESRNDTSIEGIKKTLQLEEELAEKKDELAEYQHDHSVEQQKDALQEELDRYKQMLEEQQEAMEKSYDERLEAMENAHDKEMDLLEEEKEARERALEDWYDAQTEALENWYQAEQDRLDADLERTKNHYERQIELVDEYLSKEGLLKEQAQDMILNDAENTLKKLLE